MPTTTTTCRLVLFLFLCVPLRLLFAYVASVVPGRWLPLLALPAAIIAAGLATQFIRNPAEGQFGGPTWWHWWRLVHVALYVAFAWAALRHRPDAWRLLLVDVAVALVARASHNAAR